MSKIVLFASIFVLFSCSSGQDTKGIIERDEMILMLKEVYLLENYYQIQYGTASVYKKSLDSSCNNVLTKHGVSKEDFYNSFIYYIHRPKDFLEIQKEIVELLNIEKQSL